MTSLLVAEFVQFPKQFRSWFLKISFLQHFAPVCDHLLQRHGVVAAGIWSDIMNATLELILAR